MGIGVPGCQDRTAAAVVPASAVLLQEAAVDIRLSLQVLVKTSPSVGVVALSIRGPPVVQKAHLLVGVEDLDTGSYLAVPAGMTPSAHEAVPEVDSGSSRVAPRRRVEVHGGRDMAVAVPVVHILDLVP